MTAEPTTADVCAARETRPRRSWRQFSLRTLLLLMLVLSVCFALFAFRLQRARRQAAAVATIRKLRGTADYDFQYKLVEDRLESVSRPESSVPEWLLKWLGPDFFHEVVMIRNPTADARSPDEVRRFWTAVAQLDKAVELWAWRTWIQGTTTTEALRHHHSCGSWPWRMGACAVTIWSH